MDRLDDAGGVRGMNGKATDTPPPVAASPNGTVVGNGVRRPKKSLSNAVRDAILNELILNGAIPAGEKMLTEAELCARYDVSRITVRAALRSLREAGYIDVRQGIGATVLPRARTLASGLDQLTSLDSLAAASGDILGSADVEIAEVTLDADLADKLLAAEGSTALVVRRVKLLHDRPVAWIVDHVPDGVLPFATIRDEFAGSVLDILLAHTELQVEYSDATLTAMSADGRIARRLDTLTGTPVLHLDEVTLTRSGQAVNLSEAWMLPEYFNFTLRRRRVLG